MTEIPSVTLPCGVAVPALGQGTWRLGDDPSRRSREIAALRAGLDLGLRLIDTAEMYGDGAAEHLVGEAIRGRRDEVFLVSKVLPWNADRRGTAEAAHASLRRLDTDRIDLYLLHWPGDVPLTETVEALDRLVADGDIGAWGVSNFDVGDLAELEQAAPEATVQTDQVLYNLSRRGPEYDLFPRCAERGMPVMAYSPVEQGRLLDDPGLAAVAERHEASQVQVALAWVLRQPDVIAIPKASTVDHVTDNRGAVDLQLTEDDLRALDEAFPPPVEKQPLDVL